MQWLAALDPAQPWGRLLRWPDRDATTLADRDAEHRTEDADTRHRAPPRNGGHKRPAGARLIPGAWVGLIDGQPVLWVNPAGRRFECISERQPDGRPFADDEWVALWRAFARIALPIGTRRGIALDRVDDAPLHETPWQARLVAAGAQASPTGVVFNTIGHERP